MRGSCATCGAGTPSSNRARLDSDAVMQARVELAACFQLAAQRGFEEGVCNHFSAV
ncbi:aldolase, partial [Caballeronia sp. M23-90]